MTDLPDTVNELENGLILLGGCLCHPSIRSIAEYQNHADDFTTIAPNRCGAVFDGPLGAIQGDECRVVRQADDRAFTEHPAHWTFDRLMCLFVNDAEHFPQGTAQRLI